MFLDVAFFNISLTIKLNSFQHLLFSMPFSGFIGLEASVLVEGFKLLINMNSLILISFQSFSTVRKVLLFQLIFCFLLRMWSPIPFFFF